MLLTRLPMERRYRWRLRSLYHFCDMPIRALALWSIIIVWVIMVIGRPKLHSSVDHLPVCPNVLSIKEGPSDETQDEPFFNLKDTTWEIVSQAHGHLSSGGSYIPQGCKARSKIAFLVPYRAREEHLRIFLNNMHKLLEFQQVAYTIFVVHQLDSHPFNRGMLFNVGVLEALKLDNYDCFVLHDVDLLPDNIGIKYACSARPIRMVSLVVKNNSIKQIPGPTGGVFAVSADAMQVVNGCSNRFWGWGGEDDDLFARFENSGHGTLQLRPAHVGIYRSLMHQEAPRNPERFQVLQKSKLIKNQEGLNTTRYNLVNLSFHRLYTSIEVTLIRDTNTGLKAADIIKVLVMVDNERFLPSLKGFTRVV